LQEFVPEVVKGCFYWWWCIIRVPIWGLDIELRVAVRAVGGLKVSYGKLGSDVTQKPVESSCDIGLWEGPLDAAVQAVSKELSSAWRRLGMGAQVVEPNVLHG